METRKPFKHQTPAQQMLWLLLGALFGLLISSAAQILVGMERLMFSQVITQVLIFLVPALLVAWAGGEAVGKPRWREALLGAVAFLLLVPCMDIITQWNKSWPLPHSAIQEASEAMLEGWLLRRSWGALAENLLVVAFVPAVCEECFFRLGLQRILCRWWRCEWLGLIVTAIVFSLAHADLFGLVPRFLMGLMLGLLYLRTGSMLVNISTHLVNNAFVVILYWLYARGALANNLAAEGVALHWTLSLVLTLAGLMLLIVVCRHPKFANSTSRNRLKTSA